MPAIYSTQDVASLLGVETWRIRRLYEDGTLPEPDRFAGKRVIPAAMVPAIVDALRVRGWLPAEMEVVAPACGATTAEARSTSTLGDWTRYSEALME
jgi:hypothetical protein